MHGLLFSLDIYEVATKRTNLDHYLHNIVGRDNYFTAINICIGLI